MTDLKPCPFCGSECACVNYSDSRNAWFVSFCWGQTDDYDDDDAIAAWNRRAFATPDETTPDTGPKSP